MLLSTELRSVGDVKASGINHCRPQGQARERGAPGSGVEGDVRSVALRLWGADYQDMKVDFLDYGGTASRFKDNLRLTRRFLGLGYPTASIMDLATTKTLRLSPLMTISSKNPVGISVLHRQQIPAGTYRGVDRDVSTIAVKAILVTHDKVPDEIDL